MRIGVEIELGGRTTERTDRVLREMGWSRTYDASIRTRYHPIELRSKVYKVESLGDLTQIVNDYKKALSTLENVEVNSSMGIHIHVSSVPFHRLYERKVWNEFKRRFKALAEDDELTAEEKVLIRSRFNNRYCKFTYSKVTDDRYRAINYRPAYQRHRTIEFRAFPSTTNLKLFKKFLKLVVELLREFNDRQVFSQKVAESSKAEEVKIVELVV
ncbi:MAG: hypothetical protein DRP57_13305 [Spirochaetes bacterium]|nr:MAG: hypothetical protein DRP57_13305 [Spirochaetota bacterium]